MQIAYDLDGTRQDKTDKTDKRLFLLCCLPYSLAAGRLLDDDLSGFDAMVQTKGFSLLLQSQNRDVARKLGTATLLMFTLPIIAFYVGLHFMFRNKEDPLMWSGGLAVLFTNVIIVGYVISAFSEEVEGDESEQRLGDGDASGPRTGSRKQRTD